MKVLYDTYVLNCQKVGVISNYYAGLISQLRKDKVDALFLWKKVVEKINTIYKSLL